MTPADPRYDERYRRADNLAREADILAESGELRRARTLYGEAGDLTAAVASDSATGVDSLGPFIAARAVCFLVNAARFADAVDLAWSYLHSSDLDPFARLRLRAALERARLAMNTASRTRRANPGDELSAPPECTGSLQ